MDRSVRSRRNHTLLCLMTIYGIHGVLFHVLTSPPVMVTSVIVKPGFLRHFVRSRLSTDASFNNQSILQIDTVNENIGVHLMMSYQTQTTERNDYIQNKSGLLLSEVPVNENVILKKKQRSYKDAPLTKNVRLCSKWIHDILNSTSTNVSSGTLSVMAFLFADVTTLKNLSPSAWGVFIGCLVFLFTYTDHEKEVTS